MKFKQDGNKYILRLFKGEKLMETLNKFFADNDIKAGYIMGLGAVDFVELGHFSLETKEYASYTLEEDMEISHLHGNIFLNDGKPFLHAHIVIGNHTFNTYSGHLIEGTVSVTAEIIVHKLNLDISRVKDELSGLKLLNLE